MVESQELDRHTDKFTARNQFHLLRDIYNGWMSGPNVPRNRRFAQRESISEAIAHTVMPAVDVLDEAEFTELINKSTRFFLYKAEAAFIDYLRFWQSHMDGRHGVALGIVRLVKHAEKQGIVKTWSGN